MREQLKVWEGEFGISYTKRNPVDFITRMVAFKRVFAGLDFKNLLEVGCNRGHNLVALEQLYTSRIVGIEPNSFAVAIARAVKLDVIKGNAFDLPFENGHFDMAMTIAVLSHIHSADLCVALDEIYRVSGKYILCAEYFAPVEIETPYEGHGLWSRDYCKIYQNRFPDLKVLGLGSLGYKDGFDKLSYWILGKGTA